MPLERSAEEALAVAGESLLNRIRKVMPATVLAVNTGANTVDVQVAVNTLLHDDLNASWSEPAPSISNVPLGVLRGGGFLVSVPVSVGDSVLLVFSDMSADTWRAGDGSPQDPGFHGKHSWDSPFAIPMFAPDAKALGSVSGSNVVVGKDGSDEQIIVSSSDIKLGRSATELVALAPKVDAIFALLQTMATDLAAAAGKLAFACPPSGGPMVAASGDNTIYSTLDGAATALAAGVTSVACTLVKAQ